MTLEAPWMDLQGYRPAPPPPEFAGWLCMRADRWRRMHKALYLLAVTGWNLVRELAEVLARWELLADPHSYAARRVFTSLVAFGLVETDQLPYVRAVRMRAVHLNAAGRQVCAAYGWPVRESEWERLLRAHAGSRQPEHTGAVLAFAREARRRGYRVKVLPDIWQNDSGIRPDLYVSGPGHQRAYVEVESRYHREKPEKWRNQADLQGFTAVVTRTPDQRRRIVRDIQALGLPGKAADLESLRGDLRHPAPTRLFLEYWDRHGHGGE